MTVETATATQKNYGKRQMEGKFIDMGSLANMGQLVSEKEKKELLTQCKVKQHRMNP